MKTNIRVGSGYDVHQLKKGYNLWIGGIKIEHHKGAVGHSDADVLLHVICDALLGAANLRDIGYHFPDNDPEFKDIDSKILLKNVMELLAERNYKVGNVDTTLCLQAPKISAYIPQMQDCISQILEVGTDLISIKATTTEKLGFVGKEEGIAAYATVLIYQE